MTTLTTPSAGAQTMAWRVPPWAYIPLGAAIIAEAVSNALRAYGLGAHLDHFTVSLNGHSVSIAGAVLVLAAVAISLSQARAAWVALTPNPLRQRIVAGLAAALLLAVSATAMVSHILEAQRAKVADEGGARSAYDRAEAAYKRAAAELEALGTPRPVSVIQADVRNFKIDAALWRRSSQCEDATKPDTQAYCEPILALYKERGAAARKTELEPEVSRLRDELARLPRPDAVTAEEAAIGGWWAWIMGAAVVFVATFGSVIFARATREDSDRTGQTSFGVSDAEIAALRAAFRSDNPNRPAGGVTIRPRPNDPNGGTEAPTQGPVRTDDRKAEVLAFIHTERALGRTIPRQADIAERFGVPRSTLSDWCREWEADGSIPARRTVGRCKVIAAAE